MNLNPLRGPTLHMESLLRIAQFREARRFVELFPDAYRIQFHFMGRERELFAWTLEEKIVAKSFRTGLFQISMNKQDLTTTGHQTYGKITGWSIIDFCRQAWRRPFGLKSV